MTDALSTLFVRPSSYVFDRTQRELLLERLRRLVRVSDIATISSPYQLELRSSGETAAGYRYTRTAFLQLTNVLSNGLGRTLTDIAGYTRRQREQERSCDGPTAVQMFKDVLRLRYALVAPYRLLLNHDDKLIEGLVGAQQRFLDNCAYFEILEQIIAETRSDMQFYAAAILGRRMAVWYRSHEPCFRLQQADAWPFYLGYYFGNGEACGTAVHGTAALYCRHGVSLDSYKRAGWRLNHTGNSFGPRLRGMISRMLGKNPTVTQLQQGADRLASTPLGFAGLGDVERKARMACLVRMLVHLGVQASIARDAVEHTLFLGSRADASEQRLQRPESVWGMRTQLDLYAVLVRLARKLDPRRRVHTEQAAFSLLLQDRFS
jgi:hypothetical protein